MTALDVLHGMALALSAAIATALIILAQPWIGWPRRHKAEAFAVGAVQGVAVAIVATGAL